MWRRLLSNFKFSTIGSKIFILFILILLLLLGYVAYLVYIILQVSKNLHFIKSLSVEQALYAQEHLDNYILIFNQQQQNLWVLSTLLLLIIPVIAYWFSRSQINKPIQLLINNFKRLAQGEENIELRIDRNDEFGQLGACFNEININLQQAMSTWELVVESEASKAAISEASLDGILTLNNKLLIESYNSSAYELLEIDSAKISEQYFPDIAFIDEDVEYYSQQIHLINDAQKTSIFSQHMEISARGKNGKAFPAEIFITSVSQRGDIAYLVYLHDISLRKQAEDEILKSRNAAIRLAQQQSDFMANLSHEINTPMNGLFGMISILQKMPTLSEEHSEYISAIKESVKRLENITENITNFGQLDSGELNIEEVDFRLTEFMNNVFQKYEDKAKSRNLELKLNLSSNTPEILHSDPRRILQCLDQLIDNAIKFTHQGHIELTLREKMDDGPTMLVFSVKDTGCGIPEQFQALIFDPFRQADASRSRAHDGVGIGLYLCKQLCSLLGGSIHFKTEVDQGSTFSLIIPAVPAQGSKKVFDLKQLHESKSGPSNTSVIHQEELKHLLKLFSDEEVNEFIDSICSSIDTAMHELEQAVSDNEHQKVLAVLHKIKGTCGNIFAETIVERCISLEQELTKTGQLPDMRLQLADFNDLFVITKNILNTYHH